MLETHKLICDTFCEIYSQIEPYCDDSFWDFGQHEPVAGSVTVISRQTFNQHYVRIKELAESGFFYPVLANPTEGSATLKHQCERLGLIDLLKQGRLALVGCGNMEPELPHLFYDSYLCKPYEYQENRDQCARVDEIYAKLHKPYKFLFLNGRTRPHRKYMIESLRPILDQALWTNLDSSSVYNHTYQTDILTRPGGGDSGQPYQKVDINTVDSGFNRLRMTKFDDGLVRGGVVGAVNASVVDTLRIGKFLTDFPKGPLFIVKQVGLQLSNPKLEARKFPSGQGILGFLGGLANTIQDKLGIGPTRIYNLGINTLAQVPVNAFGIHLNRHGILPVQDDNTKYLAVVQNNNQNTKYTKAGLPSNSNNRLVNYAAKLLPKVQPQNTRVLSTLQSLLSLIPGASLFIKPQQQMIDEYVGGPGSVYGVGKTFIRRFDYTSNGINKQQSQERGKVNYIGTLGLSQQYFSATPLVPSLIGGTGILSLFRAASAVRNIREYNNLDSNNPTKAPFNLDQATYSTTRTANIPLLVNPLDNTVLTGNVGININAPVSVKNASYQAYQKIINSRKLRENNYSVNGTQANAFGIYGNDKEGVVGPMSTEILPDAQTSPVYYNGRSVVRLRKSWKELTREKRVGSGFQDEINLTPLFNAPAGTISDKQFIIGDRAYNINDLVKFRIQSVDTDHPERATWMIFRAYLTQFSDNTDASWGETKYVGRGENFYIYNGFSRRIQVGFKVAALSEAEMKPMYQKLNYLMGNLMPDYDGNIMRGPLVRMTVGNWIDGQAGIINNLSYTVPNDSPWEIALDEPLIGSRNLILPHVIEVQMTFTPIGSQTRKENQISKKSAATSHIAQNINDNPQYINGKIGEVFDKKIPTIFSPTSDIDITNQFLSENPQ